MSSRNTVFLILVLILTAGAVYVNLPNNAGIPFLGVEPFRIHQGLDLQGGTQVLLEADILPEDDVTSDAMDAVRIIIENRVNSLGVAEPLVQRQGERRIVVQLPGIRDPDQAVQTIRGTGLLEFIHAGDTFLPEGVRVKTSHSGSLAPEQEDAADEAMIEEGPPLFSEEVFETILTGRDLKTASVGTDEVGRPEIRFELTDEGSRKMAEYSRANVGKVLAITMDRVVLSAPTIQTPITEGSGRITSQQGFPLEQARSIAIQLRYGALPVPLQVIENRSVGPTLGQDSVERSIRAGVIGLAVVLLFMLIYYRLPGFLADLALIIYALLNLALYQIIPVTLTLPGITGFILSTGMAVDANILIFERMKEELRAGRMLKAAIDAGFERAWTSIRDSNLSTMLTCVILYWFASNFGASIVMGFAITLFLGVAISMFTAITVSRTFIRFTFELSGERLREKKWLLGV